MHVLVLCCVVCLQLCAAQRLFCPPPHLVLSQNRTSSGLKTAIISEVHGKLWVKTQKFEPQWAEYFDGHHLARNLYLHVGILGIDKIYLVVMYNETLYPIPPTVEQIYPSKQYCVVDWFKLGVLDWRPLKYGGPVETWPIHRDGTPTIDRDYYKTRRGYNPIYAEIRNHTDWVFILDMDEQLIPVGFEPDSRADWCSSNNPPLISRILDQMLITGTRHVLKTYNEMMRSANLSLEATEACPLGQSLNPANHRCKYITSFELPVYVWILSPNSPHDAMPTVRSKYPAQYSSMMKSEPCDAHAEHWKSVYWTKHSPLLEGMSLHNNQVKENQVFPLVAPRSFHGGLSLELVHQRTQNTMGKEDFIRLMVSDYRLLHLTDAYHRCMSGLSK